MECVHVPRMEPVFRPNSLVTYACIEGGNATGKGTIIQDIGRVAPWMYEANTPGYPNIRCTYEPTDDVMRYAQRGCVLSGSSYRRWLKNGEDKCANDPLVQAAVFLEDRHYQQKRIADGSIPNSILDRTWSDNMYRSICDPSWFVGTSEPKFDMQKTVVITDRGMPSTIVYQLLEFYREQNERSEQALTGMIRDMYDEGYLFPYDVTIVVFPVKNKQNFDKKRRERDQFEEKDLDSGYQMLTNLVMTDPCVLGFQFTDTICWVENDFTSEIGDVTLTTLVVTAILCTSYRESLRGEKLKFDENYSLHVPESVIRNLLRSQIKYHQNISSERRKLLAYEELLIKGNHVLIGNVLVGIDLSSEVMDFCLTKRLPGVETSL